MSLENTELKVGNTSFKGIWIAIVITIGTSVGGTVWTASSLYSRLESVEARKIPNIAPLNEQITLIETQLADNNVSSLQAKLAELGVNLKTIAEQQEKLLAIREEVKSLKEQIIQMQTTVDKAELAAKDLEKYNLKKLEMDVNDLWLALEYLSNPLN